MSDDPSVYELMDGTSTEKNLAEDYVALLDKLSALKGAAEDGNWSYAFEKIESVRRALTDLERRISNPSSDGTGRVFERPDADAHRTHQLIIAFAQQYGGHIGPKLYPVTELENERATEKIARSQKWVADFHAALDAGDTDTASELAGGTVRIVDGMTGNGRS
jgi:hypothetical protein